VPRTLIEEGTLLFYQVPGRALMVTAYHGKTDILTMFASPTPIPYDRRDRQQQMALITEHLKNEGWRVPEFLRQIEATDYFYFSDLSQIRMPDWTKGRVALVGDAAYCASAAAGMGGSLAINGAAALGEAFAQHGSDHVSAFKAYNVAFRPFVTEVQAQAVGFCNGIAAGQMA
jgi:2-polyprenyl-6-methoxyphenol hydroxylase-like FAD-dependent oxidoreductase